MQRFFRILLLCFLLYGATGNPAVGQGAYSFYYGRILDQETNLPLENVNLSIRGTKKGTVSGRDGNFSFFTDTIPALLVVSCVGYIAKNIWLDKTSYSLTIYLSPGVQQLAVVDIRAGSNEPFYKDEHYAVRDYEIDSGLIYVLVFRTRLVNSELICKTKEGDTLARSGVLQFFPNRLFRDCMGYLHILSHDSEFQVYRKGNQMLLIHGVALKRFDDVLKNCIASTPEIFYFQKVVNQGMGVEYYGINRQTLVRNTIADVKDRERMKMLRRNSEDNALLWSSRPPDSREDFVNWNYVHKILYRPIRTALYHIGRYICIFNTPERQMEFYDLSGSYSYKLALRTDSIREGRWTSEILIDEDSSEVYTSFIRNGTCSIYRIDLNTGYLHKRTSIMHQFPQKVRIYHGYAYYLYDIPGDADNKILFRQRL